MQSKKNYMSVYRTARGALGSTLLAGRQDFEVDYYVGATVKMLTGAAAGETRRVVNNHASAIVLKSEFSQPMIFWEHARHPDTDELLYDLLTGEPTMRFIANQYKIYWDWTADDAALFNGKTIIGSCFSRHCGIDDPIIMKETFPPAMTGVTFIQSNIDGVFVPAGNILKTSDDGIITCNRKIKTQNDLEGWILNGGNQPSEPVNKKLYIKLGISTNPANIPAQRLGKSIIMATKEA